jgi:hypothetical protein
MALRNYSRCAKAGLFGELNNKEQEVMQEITDLLNSLDTLCCHYYTSEENNLH